MTAPPFCPTPFAQYEARNKKKQAKEVAHMEGGEGA